MKTLPRLATLLTFCSIIMFASFANAQAVQVCDMGAATLVKKSNIVFSMVNMPLRITDFTHLGKMSPESPYDLYISVAGQKPDGAVVSFFCNDTGFVSKIMVMANSKNPQAARNAGFTLGALLISMDLSSSEMDVLMEKRPANKTYADVWAAKTNRRILLEYNLQKAKNGDPIMILLLTALDK